jgi:hypothetical protein
MLLLTSAWMLPAMTREERLLLVQAINIENVFNWVKLRVA